MKFYLTILILFLGLVMTAEEKKSIHDFKVTDIAGKEVDLKTMEGKVVLIVNVASKCGATKQYTNLVNLYDKYKEKDFVILGFPANNYGKQEPGSNETIKEFCESKFKVSFPMFSKVSVKGDDQHELFKFLTGAENPDAKGDIKWNFEKFLIDQNGVLQRRFATKVNPEDKEITEAIEKLLEATVKKE